MKKLKAFEDDLFTMIKSINRILKLFIKKKRLFKLSKNKDIFDNIKGVYQNALEKSNLNYNLNYKGTNNCKNKKNRK